MLKRALKFPLNVVGIIHVLTLAHVWGLMHKHEIKYNSKNNRNEQLVFKLYHVVIEIHGITGRMETSRDVPSSSGGGNIVGEKWQRKWTARKGPA